MNAGIGTAYASAFKSAGIGLLNYIDLRPIPALFRAGIGTPYANSFKSAGIGHMPFPVLLKSTNTGPATLYPHSLCGGLKRREKKCRDKNFDPIPVLSGAIPTVLKMLG